MTDFAVLVLGLACVTGGAEALVRGATFVALRAEVSPLFVGLTVVGFGTSSPELGASLTATVSGATGVSVGNVLGSNIFNIGVILGITALVQPIRIQISVVRRDLIVATLAVLIPWAALATGGRITAPWGGLYLIFLAAFVFMAFRSSRRASSAETNLVSNEVSALFGVVEASKLSRTVWWNSGLALAGLALLLVGSRLFVGSATSMAARFGIPELVVGLTVVSVGTSLPELITSIVAARRGSPDIAVGNVIGSNIFNVLGILGTASLIGPQDLGRQTVLFDLPIAFLFTVALIPLIRTGGSITRREGLILLLAYVGYLVLLAWRVMAEV